MYLGDVLGYRFVERFAKFSRAWLDAAGQSADVDHGVRWHCASGGPNHVLLAYTLLDRPLTPKSARRTSEHVVAPGTLADEMDEPAEDEGEVIDLDANRALTSQPSKAFALGRNTHAQLGLGFSSQEATRGMVTGTLTGTNGIAHLTAGGTFSLLVTADAAASHVYVCGNETLGQLGASPAAEQQSGREGGADPWDVSTRAEGSEAAQLRLLPLPRRVELEGEWAVSGVAAGLDHTLLLLERALNGFTVQQVVATGLNTDGQLGVTPVEGKDSVPIQPLLSRSFQRVPIPLHPIPAGEAEDKRARVVQVVCGADTSYALTHAGDLWAWGNSEYGQSFAGVHDRIVAPMHVPNPLPAAYARYGIATSTVPKPAKLVAGGAFAALLDTQARVWVVGHIAPGTTQQEKEQELTLVQSLPRVDQLFAGLEYLLAATEEGEVYVWGVVPRSLSPEPLLKPTRVPLSIPKTPRQAWLDENPRLKQQHEKVDHPEREAQPRVRVEAAACTRDHVLLILNDGNGSHVWAECDQPPRDKGTGVVL